MSFISGFSFILFAIFAILFAREKRRISLSFLFIAALGNIVMDLVVFSSQIPWVNLVVAAGVLAFFPLSILFISIYLLLNGKIMLKRESKKLANMLSLIVSLAIFTMVGLFIYFFIISFNSRYAIYYIGSLLIFMYFSFVFVSFLAYATFYHFWKIRYQPDFIIVLGSGLIGGDQVPPLLGSRLDTGIEQYMKYNQEPKIIVSGGQGPDELLSEAAAMKKYIVEKGIPDEDVLAEDKSRNTMQNMQFSKSIMDSIKPDHKSIFVTNNYHVFRASIYARLAGLKKCEGVGAKTARYYLPSAFIREYIGILTMYKWWHIAVVGLIVLLVSIIP
ncbi:hypothetical protein XI25_00705 [Paenibacillus sp. DMB20]|nr:hypothetical protein XI25_00705 [Paenibacillus sp. DMB20]